jgi:hypothetical protein
MSSQNGNPTPSRTGMRGIFPPWEYRHLRAWASARIAGSAVAAGFAAVVLVKGSFSAPAIGGAVALLVVAALAFAGGCWELVIARSESPRT